MTTMRQHQSSTGVAFRCERVLLKSRLQPTDLQPLGKGLMFHHDQRAQLVSQILRNQEKLMADLTALTTAVTDNTTAVDAAVAALEAPATDQATVDTLTAAVTASVTALNTAV